MIQRWSSPYRTLECVTHQACRAGGWPYSRHLPDSPQPDTIGAILWQGRRVESADVSTITLFPAVDPEHRPSSLPTSLTSFVGRARDVATIRDRLRDVRLLTLTGLGG